MAGQIKPVGVVRTIDGQTVGTFQLIREGKTTLIFSQAFPAQATQQEIGVALLSTCREIISQEPGIAMSVLEQMKASSQVFSIPDTQAE